MQVFEPLLQSLHRHVSVLSLDTDDYREAVGALSELVEVKCGSVRPICNLVSELFVLLQSSGHCSTHALTHDTELGNCFAS